ncbi:MAG: hypothetical protein KUG59_07565, partial [Parvibaculaceae bacterium]|nr:hypothetical protein [Parvibaculaceae bacterium]
MIVNSTSGRLSWIASLSRHPILRMSLIYRPFPSWVMDLDAPGALIWSLLVAVGRFVAENLSNA